MIYFLSSVLYLTLLPTVYVVTPFLSLFTRPDWSVKERYRWGWIYGTHDNPPQGDRAWVTKHCPFPNEFSGWKGWANRTGWLYRNKLYNLKKSLSVRFEANTVKRYWGTQTYPTSTKSQAGYSLDVKAVQAGSGTVSHLTHRIDVYGFV